MGKSWKDSKGRGSKFDRYVGKKKGKPAKNKGAKPKFEGGDSYGGDFED
jgi:hypothetical protein